MNIKRQLKSFEDLLRRNACAIGWPVVYTAYDKESITVTLRCPCGGKESITLSNVTDFLYAPKILVEQILSRLASEEHLQQDILAGRLAPQALDNISYFKGII